ncbi:MAG: peroxiredoxin [Actinomycetales bacterium]|nr:MAG: peroxiredoxin [Actinomycetales bacterium]
MAPRPGDPAPDFTLPDQHGRPVTLSELVAAQHVALVFYPFAFSGICTGELREIRDGLHDFQHNGIQVLAISCDSMFALRSWADHEGYFFPLLSDFWPHGEVARRYGVFLDNKGCATRGTFLVDRSGTVHWSQVDPPGHGRDFTGYRQAVAQLREQDSTTS